MLEFCRVSPLHGRVRSVRTISSSQTQAAITRMAEAIAGRHGGGERFWLLGIANGGIPLAHRLADAINALPAEAKRSRATAGSLDISFHRDDIGRHPVPKEFTPTLLPGDVTGATVILVDDVLFTGRTIKASLDELFDHGRPAQVELAVLVDRGGRRLPIAADYVGLALPADEHEVVDVMLDRENPKRDRIRVMGPAK